MTPFVVLASCQVAIVGLFIYVMFIADPDSPGCGGRVHRAMTEVGPAAFWTCLRRVCGQKVHDKASGLADWLCNSPNPVMQVIYILTTNIGFVVFIIECHPLIPNQYIGERHKAISYLVMAACVASFAAACSVSPGVVSMATLSTYDSYPYDDLLYHKKDCKTCKVPKLPRSKHCRVCNVCVPRFDHHCAWINQCAGEDNYWLFLLFLLVHVCMLWYGVYLLVGIIASIISTNRLWQVTFRSAITGQTTKTTYLVLMQWFLHTQPKLCFLLVLGAVMGLVLTGFLAYHLSLVWRGMTTNESSKWGDVKKYHQHLLDAYKAAQQDKPSTTSASGAVAAMNGSDLSAGKDRGAGAKEFRKQKEPTEGTRRRRAGSLPESAGGGAAALQLSPVTDPLHPGALPKNIYDGGLFSNFVEVFWPRSKRRHNRKLERRNPFEHTFLAYWMEDDDTK